jgi:hypothetical protein
MGLLDNNRSAWARDNTPSPTEEDANARNLAEHSNNDHSTSYFPPQTPAWDAASTDSDATERGQSRWWVFARPRRQQSLDTASGIPMTEVNGEPPGPSTDVKGKAPEDGRRPVGQRLMSTVLMAADSAERWRQRRRPTTSTSRSNSGHQEGGDGGDTTTAAHNAVPSTSAMSPTLASSSRAKPVSKLRLEIPPVPEDAYTIPFNNTPGWQSPWVPHRARQRPANLHELSGENTRHYTPSETESEERLGPWEKRGRKLRRCILFNDFTPLVSLPGPLPSVLVCSRAHS